MIIHTKILIVGNFCDIIFSNVGKKYVIGGISVKKKFLLTAIVMLLISIMAFCVNAGTYGDLSYTFAYDGITITDCSTSVTSVTIPSVIKGYPVTSIGSSAFDDCTGLTSVTIPDSVTSIGNSAFAGCTGLTSVYITDLANWCQISFGNAYANPLYYAENLYINNVLATDITIPDSVTSIGDYAFYNCTGLTSVTIGESVTSIGNSAFRNCTSLTSITIPNSVTSIGEYAFYGCTGLTSVTIPDSVTSIGSCAFCNCTSLTSVTIGESVTSIGEYAFSNCTGLTQINWNAKNVADFSYDDSVFSNVGQSGEGINVVFGDSVERIPEYVFYPYSNSPHAPKIVSITIGESVTSIGEYAFYKCTGLTQINWNAKNVEDFSSNNYVFAYAGQSGEGINVVFGDCVEKIPDYAFYPYSS